MSNLLRWESLASGLLRCVGTVIWNETSRSAILIDPTDDSSTFLHLIQERGLSLKAIFLTHAHFDHAGGSCDLARSLGVEIYLHREDWSLFQSLPAWAKTVGIVIPNPDITPRPIEHDTFIELESGFSMRVIHTPGHTPGQVAFYFESLGLAVVGDTLFYGSVGRTDLPGGSQLQLEHSIRERLYQLPEATIVVPGHGSSTTIGREMHENPYVRLLKPSESTLSKI